MTRNVESSRREPNEPQLAPKKAPMTFANATSIARCPGQSAKVSAKLVILGGQDVRVRCESKNESSLVCCRQRNIKAARADREDQAAGPFLSMANDYRAVGRGGESRWQALQ